MLTTLARKASKGAFLVRFPRRMATQDKTKPPPRGGGFVGSAAPTLLLLVDLLPRILHRGDRLQFDVRQVAVDLAHLAHVLVLDDVARVDVDLDRPARAVRV